MSPRSAPSGHHFLSHWTRGPGLGRFRWLLPSLIAFALAGAAVSVALYAIALLHPGGLYGFLAFALLPGVIVVFPPAVLESTRLGPGRRESTELFPMRLDWGHALRGVPRSVRVLCWVTIALMVLGACGLALLSDTSKPRAVGIVSTLFALALYGSSALVLISAYCIPPASDPAEPDPTDTPHTL